MAKMDTLSVQNAGLKNIPFGATHISRVHIREYPPPPLGDFL